MCETTPGINTRSVAPCPKTWYAMLSYCDRTRSRPVVLAVYLLAIVLLGMAINSIGETAALALLSRPTYRAGQQPRDPVRQALVRFSRRRRKAASAGWHRVKRDQRLRVTHSA